MKGTRISSLDGIELDAIIHPTQKKRSLGGVVQVHGITADMDEGGMYFRLADRLASAGFDVLRFTYRGHGNSGGTQRGVTISGEMLDLDAALAFAASEFGEPLSLVAASFGAVSTCLLLPYIEGMLRALVLWNPVLDLKRTFVTPELPWGKENFNSEKLTNLKSCGFLLLDDFFEIGRTLYEEMRWYNPAQHFMDSIIPSIIIHGSKDTYVPYYVSKEACNNRRNCEFFSIDGSDHGFDGRENEDKAIAITVDWLRNLYAEK